MATHHLSHDLQPGEAIFINIPDSEGFIRVAATSIGMVCAAFESETHFRCGQPKDSFVIGSSRAPRVSRVE